MNAPADHATTAWIRTLDDIVNNGGYVAPRGQRTLEILQQTMAVDMMHPVVVSPSRKVSTKFLGGEAYWILTGDDTVAGIEPYNMNIAQFSDDGRVFFGAYGPKIQGQLEYVVAKLIEDRDTRQAGLNIRRENPPPTKDVPCTTTMFFNIRAGQLNMHVFMRSSDIWLGVPYDVFNFSMVAMQVLCRLNDRLGYPGYSPGTLYLTAASRHLYEKNSALANDVLACDDPRPKTLPVPQAMYTSEPYLLGTLAAVRQNDKNSLWWKP
jgi:thymidylate synthase